MTGLTSNPTIFDNAIARSNSYDAEIRRLVAGGIVGRGAVLRARHPGPRAGPPICSRRSTHRTATVDGWVSLEVSPLLAYDTADDGGAGQACCTPRRSGPNLFIKIPGTTEGLPAIEEAIFAGVPVNVTLLFSRAQYLAAADAYMNGLERRVAAGLSPDVRSVASLFVSRWDKATMDKRAGPAEQQAWASRSRGRPTRHIATC